MHSEIENCPVIRRPIYQKFWLCGRGQRCGGLNMENEAGHRNTTHQSTTVMRILVNRFYVFLKALFCLDDNFEFMCYKHVQPTAHIVSIFKMSTEFPKLP